MAQRTAGVGVVVVAAATLTCGLLLLGGAGPTTSGVSLAGEPVDAPEAPRVIGAGTIPADPSTPDPSTLDRIDSGSTVAATTTAPPSTTSTTTTTSSSSPTSNPTSTTVANVSPVPLAVVASHDTVGPGGVVEFAGRCPTVDGAPLGPVVVVIVGRTVARVTTGVTAADWTFAWTAPVDEAEFASFGFQFWCGDPDGYRGGYPAELQPTVDMVASVAPTTPVPTNGYPDVGDVIPETD